MLYNDDAVFVHVPKTGGQSIEELIGQIWNGYGDQHEPLFTLEKNNPEIKRNKFCFGFVRNPFDLEVSNYIWHTRTNSQVAVDSFDDWIKWRYYEQTGILTYDDFRDKDEYWYLKGFAKNPQVGFFVNPAGDWLVDFVGRFETLKEDWEFISNKLNLPKELPHVGKTFKKKDYRLYYKNAETVDIITEAHKIDLDVFNYDFEKGMTSKEINKDIPIHIHIHHNYNYYYG